MHRIGAAIVTRSVDDSQLSDRVNDSQQEDCVEEVADLEGPLDELLLEHPSFAFDVVNVVESTCLVSLALHMQLDLREVQVGV